MTTTLTVRRTVASVAALLGSLALLNHVHSTVVVAFPVIGALVAMAAVWRPQFGSQLLARAAWWSQLLLGLFLCLVGGASERREGLIILVGGAVALMVLGHHGMATPRRDSQLQASSFVTTLTVALVLAMADTSSLLLWGVLHLERWNEQGHGLALLACAGAMVVGCVGLYRAAAWGLIVNVITNVAIATLALTEVLDVRRELAHFLAATAILQLIVPLPMLVARRRGGLPWSPRAWHRRRAFQALIATLTVVGATYALT